MSSPAPLRRSHGPKPPARYQQRFVPKSAADSSSPASASSSSSAAAPFSSSSSVSAANPINRSPARHTKSPQLTLTTSLRGPSTHSKANDRRAGGGASGISGGFVNYLLQDEEVAAGLGGLDVEESQGVVDLLNDQLSQLLKSSPKDFWREVVRNESLHEFLDSYLQFRHRWYDLPHRAASGAVASVIVGEAELARRVFMVFYRMSSNKDPGTCTNDYLSMKEHTAFLQEKKLLDLPKLLDICAIYGHENGELARSLVMNAIKAQPTLLESINMVVSHFLSIVHTMHDRCNSSLELLISDHGYQGQGQLYKDFLEVIDFINDAIATLDAFADAYKLAAIYLSNSFEMSYGNEELLSTLARLHDLLLPSLRRGLVVISSAGLGTAESFSDTMLSSALLSVQMLSLRQVKFGWKLLDICYLSDEFIEDSVLQNTVKMLPAKVEDPAIRGDIIVQTLKEINGEVPYNPQEGHTTGSFLQNLERKYDILIRITNLRKSGWFFMDEEQFQYLTQISTPPLSKASVEKPRLPVPLSKDKIQMDEDEIILESKISQIKDLFPDYGKGFLSACLEVYNQNPEEVIQRILEGTLHKDLLALDTSLEQIPPKPVSHSKSDKGKGVLIDSAPNSPYVPPKVGSSVGVKDAEGLSSASVSSSGRYWRKSNDDRPDFEVLDSRIAKESVRSAVLAAENEYEDEYDDSFDDLGLSVVESGFEEAENLRDRGPDTDNSSRNSSSRWSSQKKPQFYVKDGKNYSYKVSGSIGVTSAQDAAILNQAQKETIYGLGRGGNVPLGAVKKIMDEEEQDHRTSDVVEDSGRGNYSSRGRGGRRGGGNHHRKDRAMKKHFQGLGGH